MNNLIETPVGGARERHAFTAAPSIVRHLIESQAGSLGKAIAEGVMNSVDAGATRIEISLDRESLRIVDDGKGFATRDEILECFSVFGFDHGDDNKRVYGKFGLGRGQLWNYCSTRWRTHGFLMDVDVRAKGLEYDLSVGLDDFSGLRIEGTFYEPMSRVDLSDAERHIARLCRYCNVAVLINGKCVSAPAGKEKWTHEDDDIWLRVDDSARLAIYNQGVFVTEEYVGTSGVGGVLVTKPDVDLSLNIARNDVLRAKCKVWPRIKAVLRKYSDVQTSSATKRLTDAQRDWLAVQTADPENIDVWSKPLFTCCNGRHRNWASILTSLGQGQELTVCARGYGPGEMMLREKTAVVLSEEVLTRFDVGSVSELFALLRSRCLAMIDLVPNAYSPVKRWTWMMGAAETSVVDEIAQCVGFRRISHNITERKDLSKLDKRLLNTLNDISLKISQIMALRDGYDQTQRRTVLFFEGEGASAFTDGSSYIAFNRKVTRSKAHKGFPGFLWMCHVMLHEYLHHLDTSGSHTHDFDFYEMFEAVVVDEEDAFFRLAATGVRSWLKYGPPPSRKMMNQLDLVEDDGFQLRGTDAEMSNTVDVKEAVFSAP